MDMGETSTNRKSYLTMIIPSLIFHGRKGHTNHSFRSSFSSAKISIVSDLYWKSPMQRPTTVQLSDPLEGHSLFTPDEEYATPLKATTLDHTRPYCPQTLTSANRGRQAVLPLFRPDSPLDDPPTMATCTNSSPWPPFMLCNVPRKSEFLSLSMSSSNVLS